MINPIITIKLPKNVYNNMLNTLSDIIEVSDDIRELCNPSTAKGANMIQNLEDIEESATAIHDILLNRATYPHMGK